MGSGNEDLVADFIFQTSAPYDVAREALKVSKGNLANALLHYRNTNAKEEPVLKRLPQLSSTAGGAPSSLHLRNVEDDRKILRFQRGFSTCSPNMVTNLHEKIKQDVHLLKPQFEVKEDDEVIEVEVTVTNCEEVPKDMFFLPDMTQFAADFSSFIKEDLIDMHTLGALERSDQLNWWSEDPYGRLLPLQTRGDGNCLLHATSLGMYGIHDRQLTLRSAVHELLPTLPSLRRRWQHEMQVRYHDFGANIELSKEQWEREWEDMLEMASPSPTTTKLSSQVTYQSLEEFHVYVLANVLSRPIIVVANKYLYSQTGEALAPIYFGGVYLPLERAPTLCHRQPLILAYDNSHFCALVAMEGGSPIIPLVTQTCETLRVHFAVDPGTSDTTSVDCDQLLLKYLDVTEVTTHFNMTIPCVKITIPLPRPTYQEDMLSNYLKNAAHRFDMELASSPKADVERSVINSPTSSPLQPRPAKQPRLQVVERARFASTDSSTSSHCSNSSGKSKSFRHFFQKHRKSNSTSDAVIVLKSSESVKQKSASVGALHQSLGSIIEKHPEEKCEEDAPCKPKKKSLRASIKRRLSGREKVRDRSKYVDPVPSCMPACFSVKGRGIDDDFSKLSLRPKKITSL